MLTILLLSIGLAMDAFAVSISCGISVLANNKKSIRIFLCISLIFGGFQAGMIAVGIWLGESFKWVIESFDHWIAFLLLLAIGIKMIKEAFESKIYDIKILDIKRICILAIATSIDALAAGIGFSSEGENLKIIILSVGIVTFILSGIGIYIGRKIIKNDKISKYMEIMGGIILIGIGTKILIEHMFL